MTQLDTAAPAARELPASVRVAVIGSGFAGLGAAIALRRAGRLDFVVLERAGEVGGTWRDNRYPGCACDVPSHLYSFSFAPNPDWSRSFSAQPEIQAYLQRTAREHGVLPHVHFGTELLEARWDDAAQRWRIRTSRGELTAEVLVNGTGALSEPRTPAIPGVESFTGTTFHSATWDDDHDLTGRRVAVIGTGASAIQFVPHVQRRAAHLTVFQRTPPWVLPRRDRRISGVEKALFRRLPAAQKLARGGIYGLRESWILGFAGSQRVMGIAEKEATRLLRSQVADPVLRAKLLPHYRLGCKRVLLSNDYYPALTQPNVDVVTDRVVEVTPAGVVSEGVDGTRTEHAVDTIIWGTGFRVTDQPVAQRIVDARGRSLAEHWAGTGMQALHGTTIAGFPNLFFLVGPNTGLGHTSIVYVIESQVRYLMDALDTMDRQGLGAIEPRQDEQDRYNARLQEQLAGTVWNAGGCASWYLDRHGRNSTLWPTFTFTFRRALSSFDLGRYRTTARVPARQEAAA
jgi:cation diffusion facilitator CzcD-associated flavoprotein CzcO